SFYLTSRGITNESYYVAGKMARFIGTNNIDNASRICHSPSKTALQRSIGVGASTCNYKDWIGTDVLLFWGSVAANNQPVSTKYMYAAKRKGTKIMRVDDNNLRPFTFTSQFLLNTCTPPNVKGRRLLSSTLIMNQPWKSIGFRLIWNQPCSA